MAVGHVRGVDLDLGMGRTDEEGNRDDGGREELHSDERFRSRVSRRERTGAGGKA